MTAKDVILARRLGGGSGGVAITDGIVLTEMGEDHRPIKAEVYGEHITPYMFRSYYHNGFYDGGWWKCEELIIKNSKYIHQSACSTMIALKEINTNEVINIAINAFNSDTALTRVVMPNVETLNLDSNISGDYHDSNYAGCEFYGCTNLVEVEAPKLTNLNRGTFGNCTALKTIELPFCTFINSRGNANNTATFGGCVALESIEIGSIGHGATFIQSSAFYNCTQTGLTITIYTTGAYADTALSNIRNGATNATIILKASEDTTYNGTSYAAGDTMITSTVEEESA